MASKAPLVSVLVLTYNHEPYISSCLKSLAAIDYPHFEIDILDDGSDDRTFAIAKEFAANSNFRIRVQTQPHSNGRTAQNSQKLVEAARGKYALFLSGDDALASHFPLYSMIETFEAHGEVVLGLSRAIHVVEGDSSKVVSIYSPAFRELLHSGDPERVFLEHLCRQVSRLFLQGAVVRTDFLRTFGGFDTDLVADDYAFMMRAFEEMRRTGKRFSFFEDSLWLYRIHPKNMHADVSRQQSVVMEVVAKYVPSRYWSSFCWDDPTPTNFQTFQAWCQMIVKHFGSDSSRMIIAGAARRFAYSALERKDTVALCELLGWAPVRPTAIAYIIPRVYRLFR